MLILWPLFFLKSAVLIYFIKIKQVFFIFNTRKLSVNRKDLWASTLVGLNRENPVLDPLNCATPQKLTVYDITEMLKYFSKNIILRSFIKSNLKKPLPCGETYCQISKSFFKCCVGWEQFTSLFYFKILDPWTKLVQRAETRGPKWNYYHRAEILPESRKPERWNSYCNRPSICVLLFVSWLGVLVVVVAGSWLMSVRFQRYHIFSNLGKFKCFCFYFFGPPTQTLLDILLIKLKRLFCLVGKKIINK